MTDVIVHSDNVGILSEVVWEPKFYDYLENLAGKQELIFKVKYPAFEKDDWSYVDVAAASFEQGSPSLNSTYLFNIAEVSITPSCK
jgi:hypothetical protein